jgi:hypothetical protein
MKLVREGGQFHRCGQIVQEEQIEGKFSSHDAANVTLAAIKLRKF